MTDEQSIPQEPDALASLEVLSGSPSPEELAAVVAVLRAHADAAVADDQSPVHDNPRRGWNESARGIRPPLWEANTSWRRSPR